METVYVREVNRELWVDLGRNYPTRLSALEEGAKVLAREVLREQSRISGDIRVERHIDGL